MADERARELLEIGGRLFSNRLPLLSLWQEIALNFYPERADFTSELVLGQDFSAHLMDSYPVLMRRELGNAISAMLRPRDQTWFRTTTTDDGLDTDTECARYLEYVTQAMRHMLYDQRSKFVKSTKEADHDFITFGQCVITVEESPDRNHLYFRGRHLKNVVWLENKVGDIDHVHEKMEMQARDIMATFREAKIDASIKRAAEKEPGKKFPIRIVVMPTAEYDVVSSSKKGGKKKLPYTCMYIDESNGKTLREVGMVENPYVIPRWHTVAGWQYAFSPATIIALPDGRVAQTMARILMEAGEKAVDPPAFATEEVVREVNIQAGGITWVDREYDERMGKALDFLHINPDMKTGLLMRQDIREMLTKAFYLDKLTLPPLAPGDKMTATEVQRRTQEFVRQALPLFEPMEIEYNTRLLDKAFNTALKMGKFDVAAMPDRLSDAEIHWSFESPIQASREQILVSQFQEVMQIVTGAAQAAQLLGPSSRLDLDRATVDAMRGTGAPAKWRKSDEQMAEAMQQEAEQAKIQQMAAEAAQGAALATQVGDAAQSLQGAGLIAPPEAQQAAMGTHPGQTGVPTAEEVAAQRAAQGQQAPSGNRKVVPIRRRAA